ncbi:unnamed protein product [Schistosoma margrebowiei]|uniref:Uncharacterized protein n=1 Tax=Schistosoma margrebowiei TaxID=48269 RepID=A0A3P8BVJ6_9TREM|nr:unnamed protein product [Schistosoma margrebowiei]
MLIGQPILRFGEMPVFTDSILYPGQNRRLQSTTHETFVEKPVCFFSSFFFFIDCIIS